MAASQGAAAAVTTGLAQAGIGILAGVAIDMVIGFARTNEDPLMELAALGLQLAVNALALSLLNARLIDVIDPYQHTSMLFVYCMLISQPSLTARVLGVGVRIRVAVANLFDSNKKGGQPPASVST